MSFRTIKDRMCGLTVLVADSNITISEWSKSGFSLPGSKIDYPTSKIRGQLCKKASPGWFSFQ